MTHDLESPRGSTFSFTLPVATEEVSRNQDERRVLDADRLRLNRELDTVLGEMDRLKKDGAP